MRFERDRRKTDGWCGSRAMRPLVLLVALSLAFCGVRVVCAQVDTVIEKGGPTPIPGATYKQFRRPKPGDAPNQGTVFRGKARAIGSSPLGVFIEDTVSGGAGGSVVVLKGDLAPDGVRTFKQFSGPVINASAEVVWTGKLSGGVQGVFRTGPTNVFLAGDVTPGATGTIKKFDDPLLTDSGSAIIHAQILGGPVIGGVTVDEGVFRCFGGDGDCSGGSGVGEALVLIQDSVGGGRFVCDIDARDYSASDWGISFVATTKVDCNNGGEAGLVGLFRMPFGGSPTAIGFIGDVSNPSPIVGGTTYSRFAGAGGIEDDGVVAFIADTAGSQRDKVVYRCDPAANCPSVVLPEVLAVEGDIDVMGNIISRFESVGIDDVTNVTFNARAETPGGDRKHGILLWNEAAGFVEPLVLKEDVVLGASAPSTFSKIFNNRISPAGLVSFRSKIKFDAGGKTVGMYQVQ
jgi:hypothetical protein